MTTEEAALRITHHIRAGLQFTANNPEIERGAHFEDLILDSLLTHSREDLRSLLQNHIEHATSADIHEQVQRMLELAIQWVAKKQTEET